MQNVRGHNDLSLEFVDGVNVLVGPNACGKTTVLESLSMGCTGKSPGTKPSEMLQNDASWMRIDISTDTDARIVRYQPEKSQTRTIEIDGKQQTRLKHSHIAPIVWFDPEQLRLLRGSPARRREYMDYVLSQLDPNYSTHLSRYSRALRQRNALLKSANPTRDALFVWNVRLSEHGDYIHSSRKKLVEDITGSIEQKYLDLSGTTKSISPMYQALEAKGSYSENLLKSLESSYDRDRAIGHTTAGPHRDDLLFGDDSGQALGLSASRGEVRTLVLALKLLEVELLESAFSSSPLLLFDDVFSELDGARRQAFVSALSHLQTIITTTDADIVTKDFARKANILAI